MKRLVILTVFLALAAVPAAQAADAPRRTLSLSGQGEVSAAPDIAVITLGVERRARTAREALAANTRAMNAIFDILRRKWGISEKDMMTSGFSVSPEYVYPKSSRERPAGPRLVGYRVSNMLTVRVRELKKTGGILDDVVRAGSNRINNISFSIDKPAPLRDEARRRAVRDALRKARLYAKEAGFELGPVLRLSEGGMIRSGPRPVMMRKAAMADAMPVPVAAGEHTVRVSVSVTWEIR